MVVAQPLLAGCAARMPRQFALTTDCIPLARYIVAVADPVELAVRDDEA